jgi:hypothetical protein
LTAWKRTSVQERDKGAAWTELEACERWAGESNLPAPEARGATTQCHNAAPWFVSTVGVILAGSLETREFDKEMKMKDEGSRAEELQHGRAARRGATETIGGQM